MSSKVIAREMRCVMPQAVFIEHLLSAKYAATNRQGMVAPTDMDAIALTSELYTAILLKSSGIIQVP